MTPKVEDILRFIREDDRLLLKWTDEAILSAIERSIREESFVYHQTSGIIDGVCFGNPCLETKTLHIVACLTPTPGVLSVFVEWFMLNFPPKWSLSANRNNKLVKYSRKQLMRLCKKN